MSRPPPSSPASPRNFGLVFGAFLFLTGAAPLLHGRSPRGWALGLAAVTVLLAIVRPSTLAWPNRMWLKLGEGLHRLTSPLALGVVYLVGIIPAGWVMRLAGKDPLRLSRRPDAGSHWIHRAPPGRADAGMKNQF